LGYAGSLQALERHEEAIRIYRRIIAKGIDRVAYGECGEGKAWARGLIADCHYRLSGILSSHRARKTVAKSFRKTS